MYSHLFESSARLKEGAIAIMFSADVSRVFARLAILYRFDGADNARARRSYNISVVFSSTKCVQYIHARVNE